MRSTIWAFASPGEALQRPDQPDVRIDILILVAASGVGIVAQARHHHGSQRRADSASSPCVRFFNGVKILK